MMDQPANRDQVNYWNAVAGEKWVRFERLLDDAFEPVSARVLDLANIRSGQSVIDIGCGTGAQTLMVSERIGPEGSVLAADVSRPMLERARARAQAQGAGNIRFELCDAQTHDFARDAFDAIVSRFGVMFFDDPVAAFSNLRTALRPGGILAFASWARAEENPWFSMPKRIAVERLGEPAPSDPDAPGPLAFRNIDRVAGILKRAGYSDISAVKEGFKLRFDASVEDVAELAGNIGPAARLANEKQAGEQDMAAIRHAISRHLEAMRNGASIEITGQINLFTASTA